MIDLSRRSAVMASAATAFAGARESFAQEKSEHYPRMFTPLELPGGRLKNRIVYAAMSTRMAANGRVTETLLNYHGARAKGGVAMIVTEPLNIASHQANPLRTNVFVGNNGDDLRKWAAAVEQHDCRMIGQIQDSGRGRNEPGRSMNAIGASALPDDLSWTNPHVMTTSDVDRFIAECAYSARLLKDAGFSGVEISAGHGHIFHQFLSRQANLREDKFGGDLEGRARLLTEMIGAIRAKCGKNFLLGVKLPAEDGVKNGIDMEEAAKITALVHKTGGVSYITYCWGAHADTLYLHLPDHHGPRQPYVQKIKQLAANAPGIKFGALGLITDPAEGEKILADGDGDMIMMGRPMLTDAAWALKAKEGRPEQIRKCVSCNSCWGTINTGARINCDNNPRVAAPDEADWWPAPAAASKRVVIVGAGLAGMEAAWVAAARGHKVTVFSASQETGGKARLHAKLSGGAGYANIFEFQESSAKRFNAEIVRGKKPTVKDIKALNPDVVILATGSTMRRPDFLPKSLKRDVVDLRQLMADMTSKAPAKTKGTAVIYDHDHTAMTYASAEFLKGIYDHVVIVTPRDRIATDEAVVNRQGIYRRLSLKRVEIIPLHIPSDKSKFDDGKVTIVNVHNGDERVIHNVALFTYSTARVANDALDAPLRDVNTVVRLVGDAFAARFVMQATAEGFAAGMAI